MHTEKTESKKGRPARAPELSADEQRLRNLAANLLFGLVLVDENKRALRSNRKFNSFFPDFKPGETLCHILRNDCSVPDGCAHCPLTRCLQEGQSFEREFVRLGAGGQEQHFRFVCHPAKFSAQSGGERQVIAASPGARLAESADTALEPSGERNAAPGILGEPASGRKPGDIPSESGLEQDAGLDPSLDLLLERQPEGNEFPAPAESDAKDASGPAPDPAAEPVLALVLLEDVTRKRLLEQKLLRAQRLEAIGTLAGGIAHEINQPLSALNLYASGLQILLEKPELPPPAVLRERVGLILAQARKISDITKHMRAMGAQSAVALEQVDVRETLDAVIRQLNDKALAAGIAIEARHAPDGENKPLPLVEGIAVQLNQVFANLLANAMHAVSAPGREKCPKVIRLTVFTGPERVFVEIADSGPGIPPGLERRIFDPFFSTKGPNEGMGLGLSITHAFVSSWGGEIQVRGRHPELGGAVFLLSLRAV